MLIVGGVLVLVVAGVGWLWWINHRPTFTTVSESWIVEHRYPRDGTE